MTDRDKLRAVAEAATQGKWWRYSDVSEVVRCGQKVDGLAGEPVEGAANATHIATFDPPTVLQLLDDLDEARAIARRWHRCLKHQGTVPALGERQHSADAATIAKWRDDDEIS